MKRGYRLERKVGEVIENAQKENKAANDKVIQTFKAEHEKLNEERIQDYGGAREGFELG